MAMPAPGRPTPESPLGQYTDATEPEVADCERKEPRSGRYEMPTTTQLVVTRLNVSNVRCLALFACVPGAQDAVWGREAA